MRYMSFILLLVACSPKSDQGQLVENKDGQPVEQIHTSAIKDETFNDFYKRFGSDSSYQVSHIVFPLSVEAYDIDEGFTTSTMNAKEWGYMNFDLKEHYKVKIKPQNDTVKVNVQMNETGVSVEYLFTKINNTWMLVKIVDQST